MSLHSLLRPKSLAIVGASPRSFIGGIALENCRSLLYGGRMWPVTPSHTEVAGVRTVPNLADLGDTPDAILIQVRTDRVASIVDEGLAIGSRGFIIPGAGYTDSGVEALALADTLRSQRTHHDFELVGPNCMGVVDLVTGAAPYVGTVPPSVRRGTVALITQSGAIAEALVSCGGRVPLSTVVSSGSEQVTSLADYIDFFTDDADTESVLAFVETISDAQATLASVRRLVESGKNIAVCVVGRSQRAREGIAAHSGKLASGARVTSAAFRQAGAIVVDDLDELILMGELFGTRRTLPGGTTVHVVTNSGGEGNMITDIAEDVGLTLPKIRTNAAGALTARWPRLHVGNPLDPWGTDDYKTIYPEVIGIAAAEPGDTLIVSIDQQRTAGPYERELALDLATYLADAAADTGKFPILMSPVSHDPADELTDLCREKRIALLRGARPSLSVVAKASQRRQIALSSLGNVQVSFPGAQLDTEDGALDALGALGLRVPSVIRVQTAAAAEQATLTFDGPVALKGSVLGIAHKSELGLVKVGLASPAEVRTEATRMLAWAAEQAVDLELLVAEMVKGDLELIVGFKRDAVFGPTCILGLGGVWTEHLDDAAVFVGQLDPITAREFVLGSSVGRFLRHARGGELHIAGVVDALCAVSTLASGDDSIVGIDINPLIVGKNHATAVDAVIEQSTTRHLVGLTNEGARQ